ncbi:hypothetical protein [Cetobacterium sp.]|uniref:hypothetical protein n=1 Tax=Cetobacterium sp. TaxID=2071632 RepID=UPI003F3DC439
MKKYKIFIKKDDIFFQNLDTIKFSFFEFKKNSVRSNWDSINELKNSLTLLKNIHHKKILIILDDIEREENSFKIKHSLIFLGELADYLKNTDVTFLFLAQENTISPILNKNSSINLLEKYFNHKIRLFSPKFENLKKEDIKILLKNTFSNSPSISEKNIEEHSIFILELLRVLKLSLSALNIKNITIKNENIRSVSNFLFYFEESIKFETLNLNSNLVWRYIYKSLEIFLPDLPPNDTKNIDVFIYKALRTKSIDSINLIHFESAKDTQASIKFFYLKGGLPTFYNAVNIEKILRYINNSSASEIDFSLQVSGLDVSYLIDNISKNNLEKFLCLNLSFEFQITQYLIKIFNEAKCFDFITPIALKHFFLYLKTEIELHKFYSLFYTGQVDTSPDDLDIYYDHDFESNNEKKEVLMQFVNLISKHEFYFKNNLPNFDISKILVSLNEHIKNPNLNGEYPEVN